MPRKLNLRRFLRQEILRKRIRATSEAHVDAPSSAPSIGLLTQEGKSPEPEDFDSLFDEPMTRVSECTPPKNLHSLFHESVAQGDRNRRIEELESLFGEPIEPIVAKEEVLQARLQQLLAQSISEKPKQSLPAIPQNPDLDAMKNELESLVALEVDAHPDEKESFRSRKSALIQEITAAKREEDERQRRAKLGADINNLPPPIEIIQKKSLQRAAEKNAQSTTLPQKHRQQRKRKEIEEEQELDGEDRLRSLGSFKKPRSMRLTGHWQSTIHNYFPATDAYGEDDDIFKRLTIQKKMAMRKELIEYGSKAAKAKRKGRRLGRM